MFLSHLIQNTEQFWLIARRHVARDFQELDALFGIAYVAIESTNLVYFAKLHPISHIKEQRIVLL